MYSTALVVANVTLAEVDRVIMDCVPVLLIDEIDTVDDVNPVVLDVKTAPTTRYGFVRPFV